jgi:hypothetical protein
VAPSVRVRGGWDGKSRLKHLRRRRKNLLRERVGDVYWKGKAIEGGFGCERRTGLGGGVVFVLHGKAGTCYVLVWIRRKPCSSEMRLGFIIPAHVLFIKPSSFKPAPGLRL